MKCIKFSGHCKRRVVSLRVAQTFGKHISIIFRAVPRRYDQNALIIFLWIFKNSVDAEISEKAPSRKLHMFIPVMEPQTLAEVKIQRIVIHSYHSYLYCNDDNYILKKQSWLQI